MEVVKTRREPITFQQLAYMAGVVDVMGSLRLRTVRHSQTELPFVGVSSPHLALLEWLGSLTGVKITRVSRDFTRDGCTIHCPEPHVHVVSQTGRWSVSGVRATVILAALLPYLQLQHQAARQLLDVGLRAPRKPATITKLADAGWPIPEFLPPLKVMTA